VSIQQDGNPTSGYQLADLIVRGIDWLVTVDSTRRVLRDAAVAIRDGRFVAVGKTTDIDREWSASRQFDARGAVGTPGFIDNHLHPSFQLARGLADEANAQAFLFERMYPYEGTMTSEDVKVSAGLAAMELLRHGVTCVVDPGNYHPDATVRGMEPSGIRLVVSRSSFDRTKSVLGILPEIMIESTTQALEATESMLESYNNFPGGRVTASASFRGLNNCSDELIVGLKELALSHGTFLQTHACFSYSTHDSSISQEGMTEIQRLENLGVLDENMLLVHAGWLEPADMALLLQRRPTLVAAPSSSMHNGYGAILVGLLPELMTLGVNVGLGSDHACSGSVDILREMFLVAGGYKETRMNPRVMAPENVVEMATINGARGAGLGNELGSVEVGKQADLVLFDTKCPEWQPLYNPVSNLVYSASGTTVRDVFVGGDLVVNNGRLVQVDEEALFVEVQRASDRMGQKLDLDKFIRLSWPVS
jgi:5-methylthioadenosine/S-adenosylhomocysteine deaminase